MVRKAHGSARGEVLQPAFDVTDHELIAGIVTEKGICRPPYTKSLKALFDDKK